MNNVGSSLYPYQSCRSSRGSAFITICRKQSSYVPNAVLL
ncbi:hypothetical protein FOFC_20723 [Fusarium oxysporum]|nr:hypothetical protein FOFC_20723 [Fusarium oxysporum]